MRPRSYQALQEQSRLLTGNELVGFDPADLPVKEIALAIAERAEELGLVWKLVPSTVATSGPNGVTRVLVDGDTVAIDAVTMIGRLPVGARVFVILSPPAGAHIVGFLGYDFPPAVPGEAIGRSRMIICPADFATTSQPGVDVPGMSFTVVPNAVYEVRLRASFGGLTTVDAQFNWSIPSGAMERYVMGAHVNETNNYAFTLGFMGRRAAITQQASGTFSGGGGGSTDFSYYHEDVMLRVGATGGTVKAQFGRNAAGTATFRENSYMVVQRYR